MKLAPSDPFTKRICLLKAKEPSKKKKRGKAAAVSIVALAAACLPACKKRDRQRTGKIMRLAVVVPLWS